MDSRNCDPFVMVVSQTWGHFVDCSCCCAFETLKLKSCRVP